jgi:hypothetical protein
MLEQIKQVSLTYLTQRFLWWGLALFSLVALPQVMLTLNRHVSTVDASPPMVMLLGMPMFILLPFLVGQIKTQFGHSRARLMPQFLPAHLAVLYGILLMAFVLFPCLLAVVCRIEPLGLLGLALAIGVPALWGAHLNRFSAMLISLLVFYSMLTNWGLHWWIVDASLHRGALAFIAIVGAILVIAWLWRLGHLNEEMDDYQNMYALMLARRTGSEAIEQRRIVAMQVGRNRLLAQVGDWWHDRLGGYYGGSKVALVRVLRYGFSANPVEVQGLFMAMMIIAVGLFLSRFSILAKAGSNFGALFFFIQFSVLLPAQTAGEMMAQRRPRIAWEMLLPISRSKLIDGLFAASARNSFALWAMMNGALAIVLGLQENQVSLGTLSMFLLLSVSTMFATMGVALRVAAWPSMAKRMASLFVGCIIFLIPLALWWNLRESAGDWPFVIAAVGVIAFGVGMLFEARRMWLRLELA